MSKEIPAHQKGITKSLGAEPIEGDKMILRDYADRCVSIEGDHIGDNDGFPPPDKAFGGNIVRESGCRGIDGLFAEWTTNLKGSKRISK